MLVKNAQRPLHMTTKGIILPDSTLIKNISLATKKISLATMKTSLGTRTITTFTTTVTALKQIIEICLCESEPKRSLGEQSEANFSGAISVFKKLCLFEKRFFDCGVKTFPQYIHSRDL